MKEKKNIVFIAIIVLLLGIVYLIMDDSGNGKNKKPTVALSTFALYDIVKHLSDDTLNLVNIIPPGVDIHTYEPTPKIMAAIESSDLIIYSGPLLEPWIRSYNFKTRSIGITSFIKVRELDPHEFDTHQHHDEQCAHNMLDPHYWLDVDNMKKATNIITYELIGIAPEHKDLYMANRDKYLKMLDRLDREFSNKLRSCMLDTIIVNHNAFSYLAKRYNFKVESLTGLSPETEVTPKDFVRVLDHVEKSQTKTVFCENFVSEKAMKTLAKDASVNVDHLHSLGNLSAEDFQNNATYEEIMLENLDKISKVLVCR